MGWYSSTYNPLHGTGWLSDPGDIFLTAKTIRRTKEAPLHYIHSFEVPGPFHIPSTSRLFPSASLSLHCTWDRLFPLFFFLASSKVVNDTYLSMGSIYGTTATFLQPLGRPEASKRFCDPSLRSAWRRSTHDGHGEDVRAWCKPYFDRLWPCLGSYKSWKTCLGGGWVQESCFPAPPVPEVVPERGGKWSKYRQNRRSFSDFYEYCPLDPGVT